jgi:hypothetical protein
MFPEILAQDIAPPEELFAPSDLQCVHIVLGEFIYPELQCTYCPRGIYLPCIAAGLYCYQKDRVFA